MSIPSDERSSLARQVLVETLKQNGPQLGAKLKPQLTTALGLRLGLSREEWHTLIPRLSHFLAAHSDLVDVQRPEGPGDIRVSLRDSAPASAAPKSESARIWYRLEVWQAFVNPDPQRRRFFHRRNHQVAHFLDQSLTPPNPEILRRVSDDPSFVEVAHATADRQSGWMREFLDTTPLIPEGHKKIARHFLDLPFDSSINAAFAVALGPHSEGWKRFRAQKVDDHINGWATDKGIDVETLKNFPAASAAQPGIHEEPRATLLPTPAQRIPEKREGDLRSTLRGVVELLDDAELRLVLVPLSAVERLTRPRS